METCHREDCNNNEKEREAYKKCVWFLRSLQIGVGLIALFLGILGSTMVRDGAELFLFTGIISGFLMVEAALASLFILREHSGEEFKGWRVGLQRAGRDNAFCVASSWALGVTSTIAMVTADLVLLLIFDDVTIITLAVLELVSGVFLLSVILISFWHGLHYPSRFVNDLRYI